MHVMRTIICAQTVLRMEAINAFYELRRQAADTPEISLDEINAEISAIRVKRNSIKYKKERR